MRTYGPKRSCKWEFQDVIPTPFTYRGWKEDRQEGRPAPLCAVFRFVVRHDGVEQRNTPKIHLPDVRGYTYEELQNIKQRGFHYREGMTVELLDQAIARFEEKIEERRQQAENNGDNVFVLTAAPKVARG